MFNYDSTPELPEEIFYFNPNNENSECINEIQISQSELLRIINTFNIHKSPGSDEINIKTIVNCIDIIKEPLQLVINE